MVSVKIGIDMVSDSRLEKKLSDSFLKRVFHPSELGSRQPKKLAGIFAVKEAAFKALNLKAGSWLEVEVTKQQSGRPQVILSKSVKPKNLLSIDCSISHEGGITIAAIIVLLQDDKK